eukprot:5485920-Amphidinium_carterae.1
MHFAKSKLLSRNTWKRSSHARGCGSSFEGTARYKTASLQAHAPSVAPLWGNVRLSFSVCCFR